MKTSLVYRFLVAGTMVMLPWLTGCAQSTASNPPVAAITTSIPVAPPPTNVVPAATAPAPAFKPVPVGQPLIVIGPTNATPTNEVTAAVAPTEIVVPANLRVSRALGDVIQLAQSGVEETIILTYVTNSPAAFLLGAEEIVYLKDLGVSSNVITSMMQRDQALKHQWGVAGLPATSPIATNEEPIAVAPTYASEPAPVAEPPPAEVTDDYFYDTLSPYGSWVNVGGYGHCWRPTVVATCPTWRPYCDNGRWVYSNCGWYWMSGYSWGSVAFHYGRWFNHPSHGWCWWPNNVWSPSWVSWRYDNSYCGWAPLPPNSLYTPGVGLTYFGASVGVSFGFQLGVGSYTYVPWGRVCDPQPYRHCLPQNQVVTVFGQTTPVNQFGRGSNNRVENRGIPVERYQEHARTELRTVKIREEATRGAGPRPERFEGSGNTLVVSRPTPPPVANENRITGTRNSSTSRSNEPRRSERPAPIIVNGSTSPTASPASAARVEPATGSERKNRGQENINSRTWNNNTTAGRPPERTTTPVPNTSPTPVTRPTPIFSKPLVVETSPQISSRPNQATPATSTTVIGGGRNGSSGRDYSVWSSPTPQPTSTPNPGNSSRSNPSMGRNSSGTESTAPNAGNQSAPDLGRSRENVRSQEILAERSQQMNPRNRSEPRSASPSYTAPSSRAAGPTTVISPTPTVNATPRPTYSAPAPAATPAPSTPNVVQASPPPRAESRPSPSQNSGSDAGRGPRNR